MTYSVVHIGGTNGKGSVAWQIAASLQDAGEQTGLFTSPHLFHFSERIRVNGEPISKEYLAEEGATPFFEHATRLALEHFERERVDWAVIEVGLGGRLDATNVVDPSLTIITSIGLDHTEQLGPTREAIAFEKAGIVKRGVPCVLGPTARGLGIEEICHERGAPCYQVEGVFNDFMEENRGIAAKGLEVIGFPPTRLDVCPPCRFEVCGDVVFDVAHNREGMEALEAVLERRFPGRALHFAVAFSEGESSRSALEFLRAGPHRVTRLDAPHKRLEPGEVPLERLPSLRADDELLVVTGSCYLMAAARAALSKEKVQSGG